MWAVLLLGSITLGTVLIRAARAVTAEIGRILPSNSQMCLISRSRSISVEGHDEAHGKERWDIATGSRDAYPRIVDEWKLLLRKHIVDYGLQ